MKKQNLISTALATLIASSVGLQAQSSAKYTFTYDDGSEHTSSDFQYDTTHQAQGWFTSKTNFEGQYLSQKIQPSLTTVKKLTIDLTEASLALNTMPQASYGNTPASIYIDMGGTPVSSNERFAITAQNSTLLGNLYFTNEKGESKNNKATLSFTGNRAVTETGGEVDGKNYALVGSIYNASLGGQVEATFNGGARMYGNIFTTSKSKTTVTFDGATPGVGGVPGVPGVPGVAGKASKKETPPTAPKTGTAIFEGKITAREGENIINVKKGDMLITVAQDGGKQGTPGIFAEKNGKNTLTIGRTAGGAAANASAATGSSGETGQKVWTSGIVAKANGYNNATENKIDFQNTATTGNELVVTRDVAVSSAKNTISMKQGAMFVGGSISNAKHKDSGVTVQNSKNNITITAGDTSRNYALFVLGKNAKGARGIYTYYGWNNITLGSFYDVADKNGTYSANASLVTPDIVASGDGAKNVVKTTGDIYFSFIDGGLATSSGIKATKGGINEVKLLGTFKGTKITLKAIDSSSSYQAEQQLPPNQQSGTVKVDNIEKIEKVETGDIPIEISVFGSDAQSAKSKNTVVFGNQKFASGINEAMRIDKIFASNGKNEVTVHGKNDNSEAIDLQVKHLITTDYEQDGTRHAGMAGTNALVIKNRRQVRIDHVIATAGTTYIGVGKTYYSSSTSQTITSGIGLNYAGGTVHLVFGEMVNGLDASNINTASNASQYAKGVGITLDGSSSLVAKYKDKYMGSTYVPFIAPTPGVPKNFLHLDTSIGETSNNNKISTTISGLAVGSLYVFGSATETEWTVARNSAVVGSFTSYDDTDVTNGAKDTATFLGGSKFVLQTQDTNKNQSSIYLKTLTLEDAPSSSNLLSPTLALGGTVIDLATSGSEDIANLANRNTSRTLGVGELNFGTQTKQEDAPLFRLRVQAVGSADAVVAKALSGGQNAGAQAKQAKTAHAKVQVFLPTELLNHDFGADTTKTVIFAAKQDSTSGTSLTLTAQEAITGFTKYTVTLAQGNDSSSAVSGLESGTTYWYLSGIGDKKVDEASIDYTTSALGLNYNIFVTNINSLNKRMGELRNNPHSQGVWARVFGGKQTNTMEYIPVDSTYVTVQGGYDYGFALSGAKNYLGVSVAYGYTTSIADANAAGLSAISGYEAKSSDVEVGIYNSYVQDEGWFSDTIAKFSYIMSDFDIKGRTNLTKHNVDNFSASLGEEFGYRFLLGGDKTWFIDPQAEFVAAYLNATNLNQTQGGQTLQGKLDDIFLLRSRVGADFGYILKKDDNSYDFRLGVSYVYDLTSADSHFKVASAGFNKTFANTITSDGRTVLNVGTNMSFKDHTRLYFDFEKSFGGKINTDYQVNVGVRYSFGESASVVEKKSELPLKIEEKEKDNQEKPSTQTTDTTKAN